MAKKKASAIDEYPEELRDEEEELLSQDDSSEQPPSDIVAFNELRSCADLVRMHEHGQLDVQPDFQRDVVWLNAAKSRFIDSLTKQLPIPSMCISLDYKTNKRLVIDGLQRISSIIRFLTDDRWRLSNLKDIDERLASKRVGYIRENNREIITRVENLTIPVTVLRCDYQKTSHMEYLFTIFHRLNTGGNKLTNQEIRNCIYSGEFNEMLRECASYDAFRDLFGLEAEKTYRFAYEEFVLRVITFSEEYEKYDGGLSQFLNAYMEWARKELDDDVIRDWKDHFLRIVDIIFGQVTEGGPLPKLSKATVEALFVGISRNIDQAEAMGKGEIKRRFLALRNSEEFHPDNLKNAITTKVKLKSRMKKAVEIFSE